MITKSGLRARLVFRSDKNCKPFVISLRALELRRVLYHAEKKNKKQKKRWSLTVWKLNFTSYHGYYLSIINDHIGDSIPFSIF